MSQTTPPPPPPALPNADPTKADRDQLKLLRIFHYVWSGFIGLGILFLIGHWFLLQSLINNPELMQNNASTSGPPPEEFFALFKWFYLVMGFLFVVAIVANLLSATFLGARRHRLYSMVVAGLNCLAFPFGTVLGIFTFVVLVRDSVQALYRSSAD
ncbi:hypothetical protein [Actomonas aquatica]|uniref:Uncharacterized protein n=1 Tax=Actomonas aquatica TaxID=2866162 RepID=A0ABZ1C2S2_9BACT|nr:hypothetical protein [Opitutus sp. WL0086]WRQ86006.1 hypothetical protein K1X11_014425 [Opitutus sp. WL0086]